MVDHHSLAYGLRGTYVKAGVTCARKYFVYKVEESVVEFDGNSVGKLATSDHVRDPVLISFRGASDF